MPFTCDDALKLWNDTWNSMFMPQGLCGLKTENHALSGRNA
jgi:hypothetical protein